MTDNDVLRVFSGSSFLSEKRLLDARCLADPQNRTTLGQALRDNGIGELLNEPLHFILVLLARISAFQKETEPF